MMARVTQAHVKQTRMIQTRSTQVPMISFHGTQTRMTQTRPTQAPVTQARGTQAPVTNLVPTTSYRLHEGKKKKSLQNSGMNYSLISKAQTPSFTRSRILSSARLLVRRATIRTLEASVANRERQSEPLRENETELSAITKSLEFNYTTRL